MQGHPRGNGSPIDSPRPTGRLARFKGPLAESYPAAVLLVAFALTPYLVLSTAITPLTGLIGHDVGLGAQSFELTTGMANAAYAIGTVTAIQLAMHLPQRRLLVLYAALFIVGSVLAASAWTTGLFIAGRIMQGLFTSLMLIAAVPPLVVGWPAAKVRWTAMTMNMCVFGAVALGPVIGGLEAHSDAWRPLFWAVAGVGVLALAFVLLTFEDQEPADRSAPWDWVAQALAAGGCAAAFFGASQLTSHAFMSSIVFIPLVCGLVAVGALVAYEYHAPEPLMPMKPMSTSRPLAAIIVAMLAAASSVALIDLALSALAKTDSPGRIAVMFWPGFAMAVLTAVVFGFVVVTRYLPFMALAGLTALAAAAVVLTGIAGGDDTIVYVGSALIGVGAAGAVAPALFNAGFSQPSELIQRVFALVELLRGVAAFVAAPLLLHFAENYSGGAVAGTKAAIWICFGLAVLAALAGVVIFILGRVRLQTPDLERWVEGEGPAVDSPPFADRIRGRGDLEPAGGRGTSRFPV